MGASKQQLQSRKLAPRIALTKSLQFHEVGDVLRCRTKYELFMKAILCWD